MRILVAVLAAALLLGPAAGKAAELKMRASSNVGYDSNIFSNKRNKEDGALFNFRATGEVSEEWERASVAMRYSPAWTIYPNNTKANTLNHTASGTVVYDFTPRTRVTVADTWRKRKKVNRNLFNDSNPSSQPVDLGARRTMRNTTSLGLRHLLAARTSFNTLAEYTIDRQSRDTDVDSDLLFGTAGLSHVLHPRATVGVGSTFAYRSFEERSISQNCAPQREPGARTFSAQGFLSLQYQVDPSLSLRLQGGPTYIDSTNFSCRGTQVAPGFPALFRVQKFESDQTTFFGLAELRKAWKHVDATVRFNRFQGLSTGSGSTSINNSVLVQGSWRPTRLWRLRTRGSWIERESTFSSGSNQDSNVTTWSATVSARRRILEHLSATIDFTYRKQTISGDTSAQDFDAYRMNAGVSYNFEPLRFF